MKRTKNKKIYFVDLENVQKHGLVGIQDLQENSVVNIFYSNACPQLPLSVLEGNTATVRTLQTDQGKQGLDIELSSYLGATVKDKEQELYIVSNDTDFDKIIKFWKRQGYEHIKRIPYVGYTGNTFTVEEPENASDFFPKMNASLSTIPASEKNWITKMVESYLGHPNVKASIYGELVKKYGLDKGRDLYLLVKPFLL